MDQALLVCDRQIHYRRGQPEASSQAPEMQVDHVVLFLEYVKAKGMTLELSQFFPDAATVTVAELVVTPRS